MLKKQGQEVNDAGQVVATKAKSSGGGGGSGSGGRVTKRGGDDGDGGGKRKRDAPPVEARTSPTQFAREVRSELRKVSWPTRTEVINYSVVVLFTVIVLTVFIGLLDWLFSVSVLKLFET
ncbi:MAG: preprotein translocase subunit SecE [Acidimicrobiales bacterium]